MTVKREYYSFFSFFSFFRTAPRRAAALAVKALSLMVSIAVMAGCGDRLPPNTVKSPEDAAGSVIGALGGSACAALTSQYGDVRSFYDVETMLEALRRGELDCVVADASAVSGKLSRVKPLRSPLAEYAFSFAVAKENGDLKAAIDSALDSLRASGELARIEDGYLKGAGAAYSPPAGAENPRATLSASVRAEFAPYVYIDGDGLPAGVDIDIARAVGRLLNVDIEFTPDDPDELITKVRYGKADIAFGGLYETETDLELVDFTSPYTTAVLDIYVRG
jgi:ABC-type amino acid transport substrate-binding protein